MPLGNSFIAEMTNYVDQAIKRGKLAPMSLSPLGGVLGQLSQDYIGYDTIEMEATSGSSSLLDNMNHIRQRLADLETSGSGVLSLALVGQAQRTGHIQLGSGAHFEVTYNEGENAFYFTPSYTNSDFDHNQLTNYEANRHIDWTNAVENLLTSGSVTGNNIITSGSFVFDQANLPGFRYLNNKVQFSHDGITWEDVGSGGIGTHDFIGGYHTGGSTVEEALGTLGLDDLFTEADHTALGNSSPHHAPVTISPTSGSGISLIGQELSIIDILTPAGHIGIGNSSPHHARAHSLTSSSDHSDVDTGPSNGSIMYYNESEIIGNKWTFLTPIEGLYKYLVFEGLTPKLVEIPIIQNESDLFVNQNFDSLSVDIGEFEATVDSFMVTTDSFMVTSGSATFIGETEFISSGSSIIPLTVKGSIGQSANLQEWQDSDGLNLASVANDGTFSISAIAGCSEIANNGSIKLYPGGAPDNEVVINEDGGNYNFRVEGDTDANLLFVDGGTESVGIRNTAPVFPLDIGTTLETTGAKIGETYPIYLGHNKAFVGLNIYYGNSSWRFGKGSSADYGGLITIDENNGLIDFFTSDAGNADGAATMTERLRIGPTGTIINNGGLSTGDFTVKGDTIDLIFADASDDLVKIGGSSVQLPPNTVEYFSGYYKKFTLFGFKYSQSDDTLFDAINFTIPSATSGSQRYATFNGDLFVTFMGRNTSGAARYQFQRYWLCVSQQSTGAITAALTLINDASTGVTFTCQVKTGATSTLLTIEMKATFASWDSTYNHILWNLRGVSGCDDMNHFLTPSNS
jgi:hypothetical protein